MVAAIRQVILDNLDSDYEEGMQYGMIGYYVPHRVFPQGYHCDPRQPLPFAGLASQKNHLALYLMGLYCNEKQSAWFRQAWAKSGKKLDLGKSCLRFKSLDDLALDVIGAAIRRMPVKSYVAAYEQGLAVSRSAKSTGGAAARKSPRRRPDKPGAASKTTAAARTASRNRRSASAGKRRKPRKPRAEA